jgi:hypothetical protein
MDIVKTHRKRKIHEHTRKIPHTEIIQKQPTHELQRHRAQQSNIQNTTRNRQQIGAQNRQTTTKKASRQMHTQGNNKKHEEKQHRNRTQVSKKSHI